MTILSIPITTILFIAFAAAVASTGVLVWFQYRKNLAEFRANLRPGDLVKMKTMGGRTVRARILRRDSAIQFVAIDIDSRTPHLTAVNFIYWP